MDPERCQNDIQRGHLRYIEEYGVSLLSVFPRANTQDKTSWTYTIGLWQQYKHPEVIVFGLSANLGQNLLNRINDFVKAEGRRFDGGTSASDVLEGYECFFEEMPPTRYSNYFLGDEWFYGEEQFPVVQMIWPTPSHVYPWDARADAQLKTDQPVLTSLPKRAFH